LVPGPWSRSLGPQNIASLIDV